MKQGTSNETWSSRAKLVLIGFSVVGAILLLAEHRAHVLPFLPWLLLAACPLMHVFMHRGHRHGGHPNDAGMDRGAAHRHGNDDQRRQS
jgi:hypothetical protein